MAAAEEHEGSGAYVLHHLTNLKLDLHTMALSTEAKGFWVLNLDSVVFSLVLGTVFLFVLLKAAATALDQLGVSYMSRVVSAHRTPQRLYEFATGAKAAGYKVIIAGAGGAAHLPGMTASMTTLPVLGVPGTPA